MIRESKEIRDFNRKRYKRLHWSDYIGIITWVLILSWVLDRW